MVEITRTPVVLWAQRPQELYITVEIADCDAQSAKIELTETGLKFSGQSEANKERYTCELEFYGKVVPEKSRYALGPHGLFATVQKTEESAGPYWPRLLKDSARKHFIRTDFKRWCDEDELNAAPETASADFGDMSGFGGMGGMGAMGGMGGMGGMDFSQMLGGAGGFGGAGGQFDMGNDEDFDDEAGMDSDDEPLPAEELDQPTEQPTDAAPAEEEPTESTA